MRNRGTFMPCLAVLVVRRAGPVRESAGGPPLCGWSFGHGSLPPAVLQPSGAWGAAGIFLERNV